MTILNEDHNVFLCIKKEVKLTNKHNKAARRR
jgi:hypothetical protein